MRSDVTGSFVIRGAMVIDGTGADRVAADVEVENGVVKSILASGASSSFDAIDASGLLLAPGFIDAHTHDDVLVMTGQSPHPKLTQGVCTVVTGNCGISAAPLVSTNPPPPLDLLGTDVYRYESFAQYLAAVDEAKPCVNVIPLVGHTAVRVKHVRDLSRAANAVEIQAMQTEISAALDAGAFGLSTGVYYPPARAADTNELMGVCQALKGRNAMLTMHLRDEGDAIEEAMKEAFSVGVECGARLVLSHHKVVGVSNYGRTQQTLAMIDAAAKLQEVCMDCYPYDASSTMLDAEKAAFVSDVLITWSKPFPDMAGKRLQAIADEFGISLKDAAKKLMPGGAIYFGMSSDDVDRVLQHPLTMIGSDGLPHDTKPHPRLWGSFPRVLSHHSRERGLLSLESAIHKMTGLTAKRFGLKNRGHIAPGFAADLVLFDEKSIQDNATYSAPTQVTTGIHSVFVNGVRVMFKGELLNTHAGLRLRP
jgi:N-acyl-D-amino-acid deacylase